MPAKGMKLHKHPAIQTYRDVFHRYPNTATYQSIIEKVGENTVALETWRDTCSWWLMRGYNPGNLEAILGLFNQNWAGAEQQSGFEVQVIDGTEYKVYPDGTRQPTA